MIRMSKILFTSLLTRPLGSHGCQKSGKFHDETAATKLFLGPPGAKARSQKSLMLWKLSHDHHVHQHQSKDGFV